MTTPIPVEATIDVVVPTIGRASLFHLLERLAEERPGPGRVILVDDRRRPADPLLPQGRVAQSLRSRIEVAVSGGRGPAAARNVGWRRSTADWVAFLDDDVLPPLGWWRALRRDVADAGPRVAGTQGRIVVPRPEDRPPTDWERNVAGLEEATWATADMAFRRRALAAVGGFDERFPRAFREDADLGLRLVEAGFDLVRGQRRMVHPVPPAGDWVSVAKQAGNADDPFMRYLHGRDWRRRAQVGRGRRPWHVATVAAAVTAGVAAVNRDRRLAAAAATAWTALTAAFAWRRVEPGPRDADEIRRMLLTSVVIPFAATWHWLRGITGLPQRRRQPGPHATPDPGGVEQPPAAVLFDRDGTLVHDVPYNCDPELVDPVDGATDALERLRALGVPTALVTNQSGVARGLLTEDDVDAVNDRLDDVLGGIGPRFHCPHDPADGCGCRKPAPGMIREAAAALGVDPGDCVVIGDTGGDVEAALAAGARPILVPNDVTHAEEVEAAPEVAGDLAEALDLALRGPDRAGSADRDRDHLHAAGGA